MKNKLSVQQNGFRDCAAACLLSIIKYYGGNISQEEISYLIKTDKFGTNAYNLIEGAKNLGFSGYGIKINFNDLKTYKDFPVIAHTRFNNMYHYVVIYEIKKNYIKIMDPAYGIKKISLNNFKDIYLETIIVLVPVKNIPNIKTNRGIVNLLINNIIMNKRIIYKVLLLSLIITVLNIILNFYLKVYIDFVNVNFKIKVLLAVSFCFLIIVFLKNVFDNIREKILIEIKRKVNISVTSGAIEHIMNLPYCYFKNKPSGELISRIDDLDNFKELVATILLNVFVNIFLMFGSIIILLVLNKKLFILSVFIILFYSIIVLIYSFIFNKKIQDVQFMEGEYKKDLVETINSYETLKNLNIINEFIFKLKIKLNSLLFKIKSFETSFINEKTLKNIISEAGIIIIVSIGIIFVDKNIMSIGDVVAFSSLMLFFTEPIKELLNLVPSIKYATNSYKRINDLLMIEKENNNNMNKTKINGDIKIENLSYSYNSLEYIFKNVDFYIKKGTKFLIYGKSGNGKSTFIKIILKYLNNYEGNVFLNNINLLDIDINVLRNSIIYISQKEVLMAASIKENIIMGRDISNKEYMEVIKMCKVDEIINEKPLRSKFLLEENGFNLSGGERQKIILARGLLKKGNIIILDEVLSEVGFDEEKVIIKEILKKYEKNTLIYISHKEKMKDLFEHKYCFLKKGDKDAK